jgi:hypothetical protein
VVGDSENNKKEPSKLDDQRIDITILPRILSNADTRMIYDECLLHNITYVTLVSFLSLRFRLTFWEYYELDGFKLAQRVCL